MLLGKTTEVYASRDRSEWKRARAALKAAGLRCSAGHTELTPPPCGCGAKIDLRRVADPSFDPETYYLRVSAAEEDAARQCLRRALAETGPNP